MPLPVPPPPQAREDKPDFNALPTALRGEIARLLGSAVAGGEIAWGGYSVAANFRLDLADGRSVFAKGSHPGDDSHGVQNLRQEIAVYENASALGKISPRYLGCVSDGDEDGWALGLWEYIAPAPGLPAPAAVRAALDVWRAQEAPFLEQAAQKSYIRDFFGPEKKWRRLAEDEKMRAHFLSLFADGAEAEDWLGGNLPALMQLQAAARADASPVPLHGDLRCDNLFHDAAGRVYIVDWPNACLGPAAFDLLFYGASLDSLGQGRAEDAFGGPVPDEALPLAAAISGFMAERAGRAVPARLPRLRWMQGAIMAALLGLLARAGLVESLPPFRLPAAESGG